MKAWLLGMVAISLFVILLELMLSEGRTKKYVQGILRLSIVFVMISPIAWLMQKQNDSIPDASETITIPNEHMSIANLSTLISEMEKKIENNLSESGIECDVKIVLSQNEIKKVIIDWDEKGITSEEENIHTNEKIIRAVTNVLEIDKGKIIINASG